MQNLIRAIVATLCLIVLLPQAQAADNRALKFVNKAEGEHRIALVIGNSAYTNSPLKNPVNDAKDVANKLRGLGFDVIERNNLQTRQIGSTLREFRSKLIPGAVALVFYAGHGLQIKGDNYLPAVDAEINSEEDVPNQSLAVKQIMDVLDEARTRLNLVFLDACRNNPYASRSFRSADKGLARVTAPSGTLISYATKPGSVAADGNGRNGLYTSKLLAQMDGNVLIEQSLKRVVSEVKAASQGKQEPWMEGSIEGDFCFAGCAGGGDAQVANVQTAPAPTRIKSKDEIEQETWESARDSRNVAAIQEYIKQYARGRFVGQAKVLIATLKTELTQPIALGQPSARADGESDLWAEVQKGNSADDYQVYLDAYPKGKYVLLARSRLSKLKADLAYKEETELWNNAESGMDKTAVEAYLRKYPAGRYIAAAGTKLKAIKEEEAKGPAMVRIPGGSFEIGSSQESDNPVRTVSIRSFEIGKYEVTQKEWREVMGSNPSNFTACGDNCPVENVSWEDVQTFLQKLNQKTGRQYRLPSEEEWEVVCYGGSKTEYCGSSNIDSVAWYYENSNNTTHPVGQKQANGYGLYDMSGNVWEWMENEYSAGGRALRGGSWSSSPEGARAAYRFNDVPTYRYGLIGFRLARTLP